MELMNVKNKNKINMTLPFYICPLRNILYTHTLLPISFFSLEHLLLSSLVQFISNNLAVISDSYQGSLFPDYEVLI